MESVNQIVAGKVVDALLAAGYNLTIFDGRYETVTRTVVRDQLLGGMGTAPVDHVLAYRGDKPDAEGWVRLDYATDSISCSPGLKSIVGPLGAAT